jgi:hypothetical protein
MPYWTSNATGKYVESIFFLVWPLLPTNYSCIVCMFICLICCVYLIFLLLCIFRSLYSVYCLCKCVLYSCHSGQLQLNIYKYEGYCCIWYTQWHTHTRSGTPLDKGPITRL